MKKAGTVVLMMRMTEAMLWTGQMVTHKHMGAENADPDLK